MAGRLTGTKMGDRAVRTGTKEKEELEERKKKKVRDEDKKKKKKDEKLSSISMYDLVGVNYKPTTRETRETYEALLTAIQDQLGDQPRDVLIGAADEVLSELKNEKSKDLQKRSDVESMLGKLEDQKYFFLCNLSKKITDYQSQSGLYLYERIYRTSVFRGNSYIFLGLTLNVFLAKQMEDDDVGDIDEYGVNVEIGDSDESDPEDLNYIRASDESEDEGVEAVSSSVLKDAAGRTGDDDEEEDLCLNPREIDAYWLQRKLNEVYDDAVEAQKKEEEVMAVLEASPDRRQAENQFVLLLSMSNFALIRLLCENQKRILWCTKLARASKTERKEIEAQMKGNPELAQILRKLNDGDEVTPSGRKKRRKEQQSAFSEAPNPDELIEADLKPSEALALDELQFDGGSHFMANKKCNLPGGSYRRTKKGYEEVYVPPPKKPPMPEGEKLVKISELPKYTHPAFDGYESLNRIQSKLMDPTLNSDQNLLVCAPTGAGKTNVALLTMMREIGKHINSDGTINIDDFKMVR